jgi:hypothetical protein
MRIPVSFRSEKLDFLMKKAGEIKPFVLLPVKNIIGQG